MNSRIVISILTFLLFCLTFVGCGVKSPPSAPPGTEIPSYLNNFLEKPELEDKEKEDTEQEKKQ